MRHSPSERGQKPQAGPVRTQARHSGRGQPALPGPCSFACTEDVTFACPTTLLSELGLPLLSRLPTERKTLKAGATFHSAPRRASLRGCH